MNLALILAGLGKATSLIQHLHASQGTNRAKVGVSVESIGKGVHAIFGDRAGDAATAAFREPPSAYTFECGGEHYVEIEVPAMDRRRAAAALRRELNQNLDLAQARAGTDQAALRSEVLGVFQRWSDRFTARFRLTAADRASVDAINAALRRMSRAKTVAAWGWIISLALAIVSLVKAVVLIFSLGVGLLVLVKVLLFGIPFLTVAVLIVVAFLLLKLAFGLRRSACGAKDLSIAINCAYAMLDRRSCGRAGRARRARGSSSERGTP
jgi:hypothetical protein